MRANILGKLSELAAGCASAWGIGLCYAQEGTFGRWGMTASAITDLLNAANDGDESAQNAAYTLVYDELKRCARQQGRLTPCSSLTPTALVSELYVKLTQNAVGHIHSRNHFFALAARAMRQIAVDHARVRMSIKRGAGQETRRSTRAILVPSRPNKRSNSTTH